MSGVPSDSVRISTIARRGFGAFVAFTVTAEERMGNEMREQLRERFEKELRSALGIPDLRVVATHVTDTKGGAHAEALSEGDEWPRSRRGDAWVVPGRSLKGGAAPAKFAGEELFVTDQPWDLSAVKMTITLPAAEFGSWCALCEHFAPYVARVRGCGSEGCSAWAVSAPVVPMPMLWVWRTGSAIRTRSSDDSELHFGPSYRSGPLRPALAGKEPFEAAEGFVADVDRNGLLYFLAADASGATPLATPRQWPERGAQPCAPRPGQ